MQSPDLPPSELTVTALVATSDPLTRETLRGWLREWGIAAETAGSGAEAREILQQDWPPYLVILDCDLQGSGGIEVCRGLRGNPCPHYQYIFIITARDRVEDVVRALDCGADDCIPKPLARAEVRARLRVASRILALEEESARAREELRLQAMRDSLTGLWNRMAFDDLLARELKRATRSHSQTGLLLLAIDHFKRINDHYGHVAGDGVIKETARRLVQNVRAYDFAARYSGDEFVIAFPDSSPHQACNHAERIRTSISEMPIVVGAVRIPVTLSIGCIVSSPGHRCISDLMALADIALYRAKGCGRNCTVCCNRPALDVPLSSAILRGLCAQCDSSVCLVSDPKARASDFISSHIPNPLAVARLRQEAGALAHLK